MGLDAFATLTKKQEDLFAKGYCYQSFGLVTMTSNSGPYLAKMRASLRTDHTTVAKASMQYKKDQLTFTPKRKTDGNSMYVLEYSPNADLKLKSECKVARAPAPDSVETTISAEYSQPSYKAKLALVQPAYALKFSTTSGSEKFGVALDGKFDFASMRLVNYNFANYWVEGTHRLVLKHVGANKAEIAMGDVVASYFQTVSDKTSIAALAKYSFPNKKTCLEFGGAHSLSCCTEIRGKVNSEGFLSAAFSKKFGSVKVAVASKMDLTKIVQTGVSDYQMGLRVDLNA